MIVHDAKGKKWNLKFRYEKKGKLITTHCFMQELDDAGFIHAIINVAVNKCYEDQHNKAVARKTALTKMLETMTKKGVFNKEDRKSIWKTYFESLLPKKQKPQEDMINHSALTKDLSRMKFKYKSY